MSASDGDLSGEELRARYGNQIEQVDTAMVLRLLGREDIDPYWAVAYRYATMEAHDAFAEGNRRHHDHETIGPVIGPDGALYGVTVLKRPPDLAGSERDDATAADPR